MKEETVRPLRHPDASLPRLALAVAAVLFVLPQGLRGLRRLGGDALPPSGEKEALEIAKLQRELRLSRPVEIVIDKWAPALIGAVVLFTAVPVANYVLWRSQKSAEFQIVILQRRMDTYSEMASVVTRFTQLITLLDDNDCDQDRTTSTAAVAKVRSWCDELVIERFQLEPKLVKALRDVKLYFGAGSAAHVDRIARFYNDQGGGKLDHAFVEEFRRLYRALSDGLRAEIQEGIGGMR